MAEREERRLSPLMPLGDALLLLCAMVGLAVSFLTLYGDPDALRSANTALGQSATVLDRCAAQTGDLALAAGIFALLSLAVWSLPRFRGAAAGALAALWGGAVLANWDDALQGAGLTVRAVTELFSRRVSWGWVLGYDPGLTRLKEVETVRLFLLLALAGLAIALGWAVVRARRWWIVALLTLPPLLPGLLADLYPSWPAFMALCACWCAMLLTDLCKWAAPDRRGALTLAALPAVGLLLWGLTLLLPREGYTRPGWALWAEGRLYAAGDELSAFFSQWEGPFRSTVTYVGSAATADLGGAGPLRYTGRTMLRVSSDYKGRLYLRNSALGRYENGRWTDLGQEVYQEYLDVLERVRLEDVPSPLLFPASTAVRGDEASHTATIENVLVSGVYTPYQLVEQDWIKAGVMPARDSYLAKHPDLSGYTVAFTTAAAPDIGLGHNILAEQYYRDYVRRHYLDVPEELEGALRELLTACLQQMYSQMVTSWRPSIDDFSGDPVYAADLVAATLDVWCEYDPSVPAARPGTDPVEYFLMESRRGYCMHFASAAVLMLREMGIPARYVSGYTVETQPGRQADVPDYAAHAWVEVYVDGYGWHPVEVTPAAAFTWYEQGETEPSPTPSLEVPASEEPTPTPAPTPRPSREPHISEAPSAGLSGDGEDGPQGGIDFTPLIRIGKGLAAIAGAFALLWLGQYLPKRYRAGRMAGPDRNRAALDGYGYLRRMERWGGEIHPRALELAQKAKFSQHTLTQEELDEMRALVDKEREWLCAYPFVWKRLAARYLWGKPKTGKNRGKSPRNGA